MTRKREQGKVAFNQYKSHKVHLGNKEAFLNTDKNMYVS